MPKQISAFHLVDGSVIVAQHTAEAVNQPVVELDEIRELLVGQDEERRLRLGFQPYAAMQGALKPIEKYQFSALHFLIAFQQLSPEVEKAYLQTTFRIQLA